MKEASTWAVSTVNKHSSSYHHSNGIFYLQAWDLYIKYEDKTEIIKWWVFAV
jgi:hypothetical protein